MRSPEKAMGKIDPGMSMTAVFCLPLLPTPPLDAKHCADTPLSRSAKLGILPKKRVDLLSTSPSPPSSTSTNMRSTPMVSTPTDDDNDPNPSLPWAGKSVVSQIPKTPPTASPYRLEDSDDELEYTRNPFDER